MNLFLIKEIVYLLDRTGLFLKPKLNKPSACFHFDISFKN